MPIEILVLTVSAQVRDETQNPASQRLAAHRQDTSSQTAAVETIAVRIAAETAAILIKRHKER